MANKTTNRKSFNQPGKWVIKRTLSEILLCECGNKYIKTRAGQKKCVRCLRLVA